MRNEFSTVFEIEVHWQSDVRQGFRGIPIGLRVTNIKTFAGVFFYYLKSNVKDGEIDGFELNSTLGKLYIIERSKPSDFSFKTSVSFSRYT